MPRTANIAQRFKICALALVVTFLISNSYARADSICGTGFDPDEVMITLNAQSSAGLGSFSVTRQEGFCGDNGAWWSWNYNNPDNPLPIMDGSETIGSFNRLGATLFGDPAVNVVYGVSAGPAPTLFSISSGAIIPNMVYATAGASAANTLTDNNGNGASLVGLFSGGQSFRADYNIGGPTVVYADMEESLAVGAFGSTGSTTPDVNTPIGVPVGSIRATFEFSLTAFDSSGGTGVFHVEPEPSSLSLLAVAMLLGLRRRRQTA